MTDPLSRYTAAFVAIFDVSVSALDGLEYQSIKAWDSVGHMALIAELEEQFSVELDMEDIVNFSSFKAGMEILQRYGVEF